MKTPFRQKNRSKGSYANYILLVGAIFIIGAVFFSYSDGLMVRVLSPIYKGENAFAKSFVSIGGFFRSKDALIQENQILKEHLASDEAALSASRAESSSADMIIQSLGRVSSGSGVLASVLVHPPETPYDMLLVDAGQDNGVLIGQKVALPEGAEIGTVTEVFKKNARVNLYSSSGTETNAVLERNAVPITLLGKGGGGFEVSIPRDIAVEVGDKVLSPSIDQTLLGVVGGIEVTPTDSFKTVLVYSVANVYSLRFVILKP